MILMEPKKDVYAVSIDDASIVKDRHNKSSSSLLYSSNSPMTTEPSKRKPKKKRKKKVLEVLSTWDLNSVENFKLCGWLGQLLKFILTLLVDVIVDASMKMVIVKI
jgi:hypothetical protein